MFKARLGFKGRNREEAIENARRFEASNGMTITEIKSAKKSKKTQGTYIIEYVVRPRK